jgi:hypothetical protein
MALATVLLSLRVLEKPSAGRILLATLAGAAAAACLQNGMIALLPLATALFLGMRELGTPLPGAESTRKGSRILVPLLVAGACAVAAVAIALPFYPALPYLDADGFHFGPPESRAHRIPLDLGNIVRFAGIREAVRVLWAHDPMLTVLGLAGILVGSIVLVRRWRTTARSRRLEFLVIAAYVAPYTAVLLPNPFVFERFMLPLLPYLSLLGGWLVATLAGGVASRASAPVVRTSLGVAVCAPFLLPPAWVAFRYGRVASAPDKYELATQWIRENAEPDARILTSPATVLPLLYDPAFLRLDLDDRGAYALPWLAYQAVLPDDADPWRSWKIQIFPSKAAAGPNRMDPAAVEPWLVETDPDYVVIEISRYMERLPATAALEAAVRRLGTRVYHSTGQMESIPGSGTGEYQAATRFAFWLCDAESFGPDLDIYRMHGRTHGAR